MSTSYALHNIEVTDDRVAFVEARPAGWAGEIPVREMYDALTEANVPPPVWPTRPSDNKCLERALGALRNRRSLVRPLPKSRGWSVVLETADNLDKEDHEGPAHEVEITAKVVRSEFDGQLLNITPEDHPMVPYIREQYAYYRGQGGDDEGLFKCSQDLSYWFSQQIIPWCHGVATRSRGGSYYVMKGEYLDRMLRVQKALESASVVEPRRISVGGDVVEVPKVVRGGRVVLKPEVLSTAAVEILLDNVIAECDKVCDTLDDKLKKGDLGLRALDTQKSAAESIALKLSEFEKLLGTNLEDVRDRIEEVQTGIGMAALKLEAEKEERKNK